MAVLGKILPWAVGVGGHTASVGFKEDINVRGTMSFGGDVAGGGGGDLSAFRMDKVGWKM